MAKTPMRHRHVYTVCSPPQLTRTLCWTHARRKSLKLADAARQWKRRIGAQVIAPVAAEENQRYDDFLLK